MDPPVRDNTNLDGQVLDTAAAAETDPRLVGELPFVTDHLRDTVSHLVGPHAGKVISIYNDATGKPWCGLWYGS